MDETLMSFASLIRENPPDPHYPRSILWKREKVHKSLLHKDTTDKIIKAFYYVYNELGYGFLEKVYENALVIALRRYGCSVDQQVPVKVYFEDELVGDYYADLVVNDCVIVELKAAESISEAHEAQLVNYLRATDMRVGLLLNFGPEPEFRRKIFSNVHKS